jgi:hypothetical protein
MAAKKRSKKATKKTKHPRVSNARQGAAMYRRVIRNEVAEMTLHQLFLARQAIAKIRFEK